MIIKAFTTDEQPVSRRPPTGRGAVSLLDGYCLAEEWTADLSQGKIRIGPRSAALHGLATGECGLITLTCAYPAIDRRRILRLFEQAAAEPASFCFATSIAVNRRRQPLFCMADSRSGPDGLTMSLKGVFLFPRATLEGSAGSPLSLFA